MKSLRWYLLGLAAIAAVGVVMAVAFQPASNANRALAHEQRFMVRGEIRGVDSAASQLRIRHEEIPNYMAAMTMPFDVHNAALLRGLKPGDQVGFELVVT